MDVAAVLERLNADMGTTYVLQGRVAGGENHGATRLIDAVGSTFVLKVHDAQDILPRLHRAQAVTRRLRELALPVPEYVHIGLVGHTIYWVQTALPGDSAMKLTVQQLETLLEWNAAQAGQAISAEQDWSWYVRAVVFEGESGWAATLRDYSAGTQALLVRLERLTAGRESALSRSTDIVHGDLCLGNILGVRGQLSGFVDWDAAGCGDRALDLAKPLFDVFENRELCARLITEIVRISGYDALVVLLTYSILAQLDWSIRHHSSEAVTDWLFHAEGICRVLEAGV